MTGTWFLGAAAIYGERIRAAVLRPKLKLQLVNSIGELTTQIEQTDQAPAKSILARYFHMRLTNERRFPVAHEVEVLLTKLEDRGADGNPRAIYEDDIPFSWKYGLYDRFRTIGHATRATADLLFVREDRLQLLAHAPNNLGATMLGETHIWITAVARGLEGESNPLRIKVDWDGHWDRGDAEMQRHLKIAVVE
ncbi:MAG: hypothetical protein ACHQ50_15925 [Fimbriimonadales bacterium]